MSCSSPGGTATPSATKPTWTARVRTGRSLLRRDRPPDTVNPRAKGRRKGKVTADRWNQ